MAEQLRGPFEKFVDWWHRAAVMQRRYNSGALPPVHEIFKWLSYFGEFKHIEKIQLEIYPKMTIFAKLPVKKALRSHPIWLPKFKIIVALWKLFCVMSFEHLFLI
jgi:hypothetical protein